MIIYLFLVYTVPHRENASKLFCLEDADKKNKGQHMQVYWSYSYVQLYYFHNYDFYFECVWMLNSRGSKHGLIIYTFLELWQCLSIKLWSEGWSAALCRLWSHFHPLRETAWSRLLWQKRGLRADVSSISHRKPHFVHFNFLRLDNSQEQFLDHAGLAWVLYWLCVFSSCGGAFYLDETCREVILPEKYLLPFIRTLQYIVHKQKVTHDVVCCSWRRRKLSSDQIDFLQKYSLFKWGH